MFQNSGKKQVELVSRTFSPYRAVYPTTSLKINSKLFIIIKLVK
jgi:hypothetical protein